MLDNGVPCGDARRAALCRPRIAQLLTRPHRSVQLFELFIAIVLLPRLRDRSRVFMFDNATWHKEANIANMLAAAAASGHPRHRYLYRPVHSPDFAPSEGSHAHAEKTMERFQSQINEGNFVQWLKAAYATIDARLGRAFFANAYYCAPGYTRKRYHGQQVCH